MGSKENVGSKKNGIITLVQKFHVQKNLELKTFWGQKNFWTINFWSPTRFLGKIIWVQKNLSQKFFGTLGDASK